MMKRGSYTVEAALVLGVLLPLIVGLMFLGIYRKVQGEVLAEAVEQAVIRVMQEESAEEEKVLISREVPVLPFGNRFFQLGKNVKGEWSVKKDHPEKIVFRLHSLKKLVRQVRE